jgi:hypothetical protein
MRLSLLLFVFFLSFCNNPSTKQPAEKLPNTPETVSRKWQTYLDHNELEKVAALSTSNMQGWLAENKAILLADSHVYRTHFLKMNCKETGDKATCYFLIREEGELIEDIFVLKKINGQWLVDLEEDSGMPQIEEAIFKEMQRELNLSQ